MISRRARGPGLGPAVTVACLYWLPLWLLDLVYPYPLRQTLGNPVLLALCGLALAVVAACAGGLAVLAWLVVGRFQDTGGDPDAVVGGFLAAGTGAALLLRAPVHDAAGGLGLTSGSGLLLLMLLAGATATALTWLAWRVTGEGLARSRAWWLLSTVAWAAVVGWQLRLRPGDVRVWMVLPAVLAVVVLALLPHTPRRRHALLAAAALVAAGVPVAIAAGRPYGDGIVAGEEVAADASRPNVVLVVIDTVRADHTSLAGHRCDTTPALAGLASTDATVFTNAVPGATATIPSVKALFTSQSPSRGGLELSSAPPAAGAWTMARAFRAAGYATAGFSANGVVEGGFAQGFERFVSGCGYSYLFRSFVLRSLLSGGRLWEMYGRLGRLGLYKTRGETVVGLAERWLDRRDRSRPFFLYLHLLEPHWPYRDYGLGCVDRSLRAVEPTFDFVELLQLQRGDPANLGLRGTPQLRELEARHDDSLRRADDLLDSFLAGLNRRTEPASSLIVVVGDHGEAFFEHASYGHGFDVFEEQAHVPLVIRWPAALRGAGFPARVDQPVSVADLLPTFTELLGLPGPPTPFAGHPLPPLPGSGAPAAEPPPVACESYPIGGCIAAYREGSRKVRLRFDHTQSPAATTAVNVFDLDADPAEHHPLSPDDPAVAALVDRARRYFEEIWRSWDQPADGGRPGASGDTARDQLRALGYLD